MEKPFKLNKEEENTRHELEVLFEVMERQGAIGYSSAADYIDSLDFTQNHNLENTAPEGNIVNNFDKIIFDFDGVIYDSVKPLYIGALEMVRRHAAPGIEIPSSWEVVANSFHSPFWEYFKRFGITFKDHAEALAFQREFQEDVYPKAKSEAGEATLYPEVYKVLQELGSAKSKNSELKLYLVSAGNTRYINEKLKEFGLSGLFEGVFADKANKADSIREIVGVGGALGRAVMIGDLPSDIKDGKVAGVRTIAVARGERERERLAHFLPDYVVGDLTGLLDLKRLKLEDNK